MDIIIVAIVIFLAALIAVAIARHKGTFEVVVVCKNCRRASHVRFEVGTIIDHNALYDCPKCKQKMAKVS